MNNEVGPLSIGHWQPLTMAAFSLRGDQSRYVKNPRRLVTSMLIASQRHQLRPMISQCMETVANCSCFDANDLFAAIDDALPYFDTSQLPLDTSSLLVKLLKMFQPAFYANLSIETLISNTRQSINIPLVSFVNILTAHYALTSRYPVKMSFLNEILFQQQSVVVNLKHLVADELENIHDEVRIIAFQLLIQIMANCANQHKKVDNAQSKLLGNVVENLLDFVVEKALPVLCTSNTTPSRERFCSILIGALSTDPNPTLTSTEKTRYINRVLSKLVEMPFDESNYAVQRCMCRFFRDLTFLTPNLDIAEAVYSKLLSLCRSDFNDVRHSAEEISLEFGEKCIACNQMSLDFVEITKQNMVEAVQVIHANNNNLDIFLPGKSAFLFVHCKAMITKCKCWDTGYARLKLIDNITLVVDFSFNSSKQEDQDCVLLEDITKAVKGLLNNFEESRSLLLLFLLSVGNLIMQSLRRDAAYDSALHSNANQAYFQCCTNVYWKFFGDTSPAFQDKSLGGYELSRENPTWPILQTIAKNFSAFCALSKVSSKEHNVIRREFIAKIIRRTILSTLHFGLLEEYSNLLFSAVVAWPETVAPGFEMKLCQALFQPEDENNDHQLLELSPGEVRRGGGLPLAFVALFNGLGRIEKQDNVERILRKSIIQQFDQEKAQLSTQTAVFHVLRAMFAFGDGKIRAKLQDEVANMALLSLKMSAPFQTRNAAIQALSACVHPLIGESISSIWKFARTFPTSWQTIRLICKNTNSQEVLSQTAALSILAKLNPLISPNDADPNSADLIDETFDDDLLAIVTTAQVAYVRSAAASALVCVACSDPVVDPVQRASLLLSSIIQFTNKWCSTLERRNTGNFLPENGVHGLLLVIDRSVSMMQSSWFLSNDQQQTCSNLLSLTRLPAALDRSCPAVVTLLRRLVKFTNPRALFLQNMMKEYLANFS